jgi:pyruvate kinase
MTDRNHAVGLMIEDATGIYPVTAVGLLGRMDAVIDAAIAYRKAEQDSTPRIWRGKDLQDLATALDNAIEALSNSTL